MPRDNTWTNSDGLIVGFGTHTEDNGVGAVTGLSGTQVTYTIELPDATLLEDTDAITVASIPPQSVAIPRGAILNRATFSVTTAFTSGGAATLDIGFYSAAAVVDDANGIDVDIALTAIDAIGDVVVCDGALVGGVIPLGATSNSDVFVVFGDEAAVYTAGAGVLTLEMTYPHGSQGRTLAA
jgi:hypothetical protein